MRRVNYLKFIFFLIFSAVSLSAMAQPSLTVEAPAVVSLSEVFRVVFSANGKVDDFTPPSFDNFEVLAGPVPSTMSSTQIINGKRTHSVQNSYTYTLRPKSVGKFQIGPAKAQVDKQGCSSAPKVIEVIAEGTKKSNPGVGDDILLRVNLNKTNVVKGEPLSATIKLYVQESAITNLEDIRFPSFNGFWNQDIREITNIEFVRENYNGEIYNTAVLKHVLLIPQQTGVLEIDPSELVCLLQVRSSRTPNSIFESFFDAPQTVRKRVVSPSVKVNVKPLPSGAPASFQGAVGEYKIGVSLAKDTIEAHEATSLRITLSGKGNMNLIEAPSLSLPADFESYDVKKTDNFSIDSEGYSGTRIFEYPFIPRSQGEFVIPSVEFTYFDKKTNSYKSLTSESKTIFVKAGNSSQATIVQGVSKQGVKNLSEDIRFISTSTRLKDNSRALVVTPLYYIVIAIFVVVFLLCSVLIKRNIEQKRDVVGSKNRKAKKVAVARLKNCQLFMKQSLRVAFYEELHKAIEGYIADKLMLPIAELSRDRISSELEQKGKTQESISQLFSLLDACEYARYAPGGDSSAMEKDYKIAVKVISELES